MSASREDRYGDREVTREDVLQAFRREHARCKFPEQATDAEIQAILSSQVPMEAGSCGPNEMSAHCKMTAREWKFWAHWVHVMPELYERPMLSGKRAFVKAAREAFGIGFPAPNRGAAIETLATPPALHHKGGEMKGEILPPAGVDLEGLLAPLDDHELDWPEFDRLCGELAQRGWRMGVTGIIVAGRALAAYRERAGHGQWAIWLDQTLPISQHTAGQLMRIARDPNIGRHVQIVANGKNLLPDDRRVLDEIAGLPAGQFDSLIDDGVIHAEMRRGDLKRHLVAREHEPPAGKEPPALPDGKFSAILADPPWSFETRGAGGKGRSAENHYPTMTLDEIIRLPVREVAADNAALFLWVTSEMLPRVHEVMSSWGFELKSTAFVWVKGGAPGLGYWTRKGAEICLLGTRGGPKRLNADVGEVIHAAREEHSRKPYETYLRIERLVGGPYLEVFARPPYREDWTVWGNAPPLREEAAE